MTGAPDDYVMDVERLADRTPVALQGSGREASVLVPLVDCAEGTSLLFTKRTERLTEHPGQMSFPGGGREPGDRHRFDTATREAREEIGLAPSAVTRIGRLDDIRTVSDYVVTPFVVRIPDRPYEPDGYEVAEVVRFPVAAFLETSNYEREWRERPGASGEWVHYFRIDGYTVWGATGRLVAQLLELTTDWPASRAHP